MLVRLPGPVSTAGPRRSMPNILMRNKDRPLIQVLLGTEFTLVNFAAKICCAVSADRLAESNLCFVTTRPWQPRPPLTLRSPPPAALSTQGSAVYSHQQSSIHQGSSIHLDNGSTNGTGAQGTLKGFGSDHRYKWQGAAGLSVSREPGSRALQMNLPNQIQDHRGW